MLDLFIDQLAIKVITVAEKRNIFFFEDYRLI